LSGLVIEFLCSTLECIAPCWLFESSELSCTNPVYISTSHVPRSSSVREFNYFVVLLYCCYSRIAYSSNVVLWY